MATDLAGMFLQGFLVFRTGASLGTASCVPHVLGVFGTVW
jgi:hypothetical protein